MTTVDGLPGGPTAVVGTGLIGTSIALACGRAGDQIRGFDADPAVLKRAAERSGLVPCDALEACVAGASVVVVSVPIGEIAAVTARCLSIDAAAIVTDVGSVKSRPLAEVEVESGSEPSKLSRFVGGHPMGGSERTGPEAASATLLEDAVWVLTPGARTASQTVDRVAAWVKRLGARPMIMDASRHDRLVALVSHLPQVASTALMAVAMEEEAGEPDLLLLAAGGFRDLTRLAGSSPTLWRDILRANGDELARALDLFVARLGRLQDAIASNRPEDLELALAEAKRARLALSAKPAVKAGVALLQVPIPDRPGVLALLTSTLGERGVNIEDLQIVHSPEGGRGTAHLTVAASEAVTATDALSGRGFDPTRVA
jgi:prephenate dehydrogenase